MIYTTEPRVGKCDVLFSKSAKISSCAMPKIDSLTVPGDDLDLKLLFLSYAQTKIYEYKCFSGTLFGSIRVSILKH